MRTSILYVAVSVAFALACGACSSGRHFEFHRTDSAETHFRRSLSYPVVLHNGESEQGRLFQEAERSMPHPRVEKI